MFPNAKQRDDDVYRSDRPGKVRRLVLESLLETGEATACVFVGVVEVDETVYFTNTRLVRAEKDESVVTSLEGRPAPDQLVRRIRRPADDDGFGSAAGSVVDRAVRETRTGPSDARCTPDALDLLVYRGSRFLGLVCVLSERRFGRSRRRALDEEVVGATSELRRAEQLEAAMTARPLYLVCTSDGRLRYASASVHHWLTVRRRGAVQRLVRRTARGEAGEEPVIFDGLRARTSRLQGRGPSGLYLVRLCRAKRVEMAPDAVLTPTQREVASYAAHGATAAEIAEAMQRSPHTVRSHLKNIYERLGIGSRVELARTLEE